MCGACVWDAGPVQPNRAGEEMKGRPIGRCGATALLAVVEPAPDAGDSDDKGAEQRVVERALEAEAAVAQLYTGVSVGEERLGSCFQRITNTCSL